MSKLFIVSRFSIAIRKALPSLRLSVISYDRFTIYSVHSEYECLVSDGVVISESSGVS